MMFELAGYHFQTNVLSLYTVGKDAQWYAVQEGDATMLIQGFDAWTKK